MVSTVSFDFRVALLILVPGVDWTGLFFGIAMAHDLAATGEFAGEAEPGGGTERGDAADTEPCSRSHRG